MEHGGKVRKKLMSFIFFTGFNIEDLINVPPLKEGKPVEVAQGTNENNLETYKTRLTYCLTLLLDEDMLEIKVDQMIGKLRRLQQGSVLNGL